MEALVWTGAVVTLAGVASLVWCMVAVQRARREALDESAMKAKLQKAVAMNMGALVLSAIGLMMVVVGILLG
ncbi:MAG: hypothetical protein F4Y60_04840 [Boseongicola sp. SB0664_bin_43]|uniref:Uncharacterized protein n=1 Tax=Boseongicola sp. SB0664_bin_43 TaxID=2604844 RepID=A0A6B0Y0Z2_9RHOB|nr:hypothetical protein [Boseongicola sp. SB0664_bin_43]